MGSHYQEDVSTSDFCGASLTKRENIILSLRIFHILREQVLIDWSSEGGAGRSINPVLIQCEGGVKDDHTVKEGVKGVKVKVATSSRDGTDRKLPGER